MLDLAATRDLTEDVRAFSQCMPTKELASDFHDAVDTIATEMGRMRTALERISNFKTLLPNGGSLPTPESRLAQEALNPPKAAKSEITND
jgi:hypothetical protein